jgi:hypothetical protein
MLKDLKVVDGTAAGAWIAPRLEGGFGGDVKQQVPNGYDAYVRIFHPAYDRDGNPATWAEVAKTLGRTAHREMQWHRLVGVDDSFGNENSEWPGSDPSTGELDEIGLEVLRRILQTHTRDPKSCFFGLSTIHGGVEESYPEAVQLSWPNRDFVIFSGPLSAVDQLGYGQPNGGFVAVFRSNSSDARPPKPSDHWWSRPPNLIWPADHSWYVAGEYDLDSTLVGGGSDLVDAILAAPELEAWSVERSDSLEADADKIN